MQENRYDDPEFFEKYSQMDRSRKGLSAAGEWETLEKLLPDFPEESFDMVRSSLVLHYLEDYAGVAEPMPPQSMVDTVPGMRDEVRCPMMLIVSVMKP